MAAMRMPFFNKRTSQSDITSPNPLDGNSILAYYTKLFGLSFEDFPQPGSEYATTGVWLNDGLFDNPKNPPVMKIWEKDQVEPPVPFLKEIWKKSRDFFKQMTDVCDPVYTTDDWPDLWSSIIAFYKQYSFREIVVMSAKRYDSKEKGNFGGIGLTEEQSSYFYSIGGGDGSWGAFYDVSSLYPIRTFVFGCSAYLQLIHGRFKGKEFTGGPYQLLKSIPDSYGTSFEAPNYLGVRSYDECNLFLPCEDSNFKNSFYDSAIMSATEYDHQLLTSTEVVNIKKTQNGKIDLKSYWNNKEYITKTYDAVFITIPSWLLELKVRFEGFSEKQFPRKVITALARTHWETSCKVFIPLKPTFFTDKNNRIPQLIVSDSFIHDVYAYKYSVLPDDYGPALLISYTWEDDATKFISYTDEELAGACIAELDRICMRATNIKQSIEPYIDGHRIPFQSVIHWEAEPYSMGCARLYRPDTYDLTKQTLLYNQNNSSKSNLYFAGEGYDFYAGWTEPSYRGAIDGIIHFCNNFKISFNNKDFDFSKYPKVIE
jgi:tryptophan 2-monooxygenase